jgi:hypothetical protein
MEMTHHLDMDKTTAIPQSGGLKGSILRIRKAWKDSFRKFQRMTKVHFIKKLHTWNEETFERSNFGNSEG